MIGSVVDGEDVVQDALAKAYYALPTLTAVANSHGWLFRIAHNKAIDELRRSNQQHTEHLDDHPLVTEVDVPRCQTLGTASLGHRFQSAVQPAGERANEASGVAGSYPA
jgi:RNA polymerase sigma-70 factor (ECF subfamily)